MPLFFLGTREWRNRQTRTVQVRVPVMEWGFNSPLAHDETADPSGSAVFVFPGCGLWPRWCSGRRRARLWGRAALWGPAAVCAGGRRPAREIATRELRSEWSISRPALALPPPTGTAARPRHRPSISHVIPLRLVQTLNVRRWNCNVFGVSRKMTAINYVRNMGGGDVLAARGHRSQASCLEARTSPATAHRHCGRSLRRPPHQWGLVADVLLGALLRSQAGSRAATCSLSSVSHAIPGHLQFVT